MRRMLVRLGLALVVLVLVDASASYFALRDGVFLGRRLPPFGEPPTQRVLEWERRLRQELAAGEQATSPTRFDAELGWEPRPGWHGDKPGDVINSIGARGAREYSREKPVGLTRVVCFGDSYTYGDEVAEGEAWPARLAALDERLEVVNLGVQAYGTDQALLRFRKVAPTLAADVFVLGMLLENIGRNVNRYRPLYYPATSAGGAKPRFRLPGRVEEGDGELELVPLPFRDLAELVRSFDEHELLPALAEHEYWRDAEEPGLWRHSSLGRLACAWRAYHRRQTSVLWSDPTGEPFLVTLAIVETFRREALAAGARASLLVLFPRNVDLDPVVAGAPPFWSELLTELDRKGIEHLDTADVLLDEYRAGRERGLAAPLYVNGHLGVRGNQLVADAVHDWLARRGLIPP